jgi:Na+-translocating ferredoxin:NAD+ oxidoreductase RnfA subunit
MTVMKPGPFAMGPQLAQWFVYILVVTLLSAIIASTTLNRTTHEHLIIHTVALSAFLGFAVALWQMSIWYHRSVGTTLRSTIDGAIYALITAATFAWLWPR